MKGKAELKEKPEKQDYSGPFDPNLKLKDFSKEMLRKRAVEASKFYLLLSGLWFNYTREKFTEEIADQLHWEVWESLGDKHEINRPRQALEIYGHDVESVLKWVQMDPGVGLVFDCEVELKDKDHGEIRCMDCNALRYMERHHDNALLENACGLDIWGFPKGARRFHPDLKMKALKIPHRKSPKDPACIWEVTMDPTHSSLVNPDLPEYAQRAAAKSDPDFPLL